jgi:RHS repeat-associated protein
LKQTKSRTWRVITRCAFLTQKERDNESGLDYFGARCYSNAHGRFTGTDPLLNSGRPGAPQSWNRYGYVLNNPLILIDPDGLYECKGTSDECSAFRQALANAKAKLAGIEKKYGKGSDEYKKAERALNAYGCESKGGNCVDANGKAIADAKGKPVKDTSNIVVSFDYKGGRGETDLNGNTINIRFAPDNFAAGEVWNQGLIGNEGSNAADAQDFLKTGKSVSKYQSEFDSLFVHVVIAEFVAREDKKWTWHGLRLTPPKGESRVIETWNESWETPDLTTVRTNRYNNLNTYLKEDADYQLTPTNARGKAPIFFKKRN